LSTALRPFSFAEILDGAFALYRRHFVVLYATALVPTVPLALLSGLALYTLSRRPAEAGPITLAVLLLAPGLAMVMWGALQQQVSSAVLGQPVSIAAGYAAGIRSAIWLWILGIIIGIAWVLFTFISVLGVGAGALVVGNFGIPGAILAILIWIGGVGGAQLVFFSLTYAAPTVIVLERRNTFVALARGMELSRDALPRAMGLIGICGVIAVLPAIGLLVVTGIASAGAGLTPSAGQIAVEQAGNLLVGSLVSPFLAACLTLLYFDRRVRMEALDIQVLAERMAG
jgi:hypothetical protein